ncbi:hypothetical protein Tco_0707721 [Tanacetum coccineum]
MAFRNFMKKSCQTPTFSVRPMDIPIDAESPSVGLLVDSPDDDRVQSSSVLKDKGVSGLELAVVGEGCSDQNVVVMEGSKKRRSITEALEEEATVIRPMPKKKKNDGPKLMSARGNVPPPPLLPRKASASTLGCLPVILGTLSAVQTPFLLDKLGYLSFDELVNVYDVHALQMAVVGNMFCNESRIMSLNYLKLKDDFVSLKSKKGLLEHEIVAASTEESNKQISEELDGLKPRLKEAERLAQRCKDLEQDRDFLLKKSEKVVVLSSKLEAAKLERVSLVKNFLPLVVKKLFGSEHFNQALRDLQQKAITFGRSQALDEVHGLGDS